MKKYERFRYNATWYYVALIFTLLPLFFMRMYFNISQEKWLCFILCTIAFFFIITLSYLFDENGAKSFSELWKNMGVTEYAFIGFVIITVISTLLSDDRLASITGNKARYNGLSNIIAYFFVFITVRKYYFNMRSVMSLFAVIGALVSTTAVCQYLTWDPIGMYEGVTIQSVHRMISTIGNRNIYASFLSIMLPLTVYLYVSCDKLKGRIIYGCFLMIGFAGGIASNSDSFYIGVFVGLIVMLCAGGMKLSDLKRLPRAYTYGALGDFIILMAARTLRNSGAEIRPSQGFTAYFTAHPFHMLIIFTALLLLSISFTLIIDEESEEKPMLNPLCSKIATIVLIAGIAFVFLWAILKFPFPDAFGSYRGFIWRLAVTDFAGLSVNRQLFGYGPETLLNVYKSKYHDEMVGTTGVIYDNVHCEPLEYLVTSGILGFLAYMILIVSMIVRLYKASKTDRDAYLYLIPIFAYFAQSFVNIAQSATTPLFFLIIACGAGFLNPEKVKKI